VSNMAIELQNSWFDLKMNRVVYTVLKVIFLGGQE